MLQVGLTGGIASGKSTVATMLASLGAVLVDADRIARDVVEPGTSGLAAVEDAFGSEVLRADGTLDRQRLAQLVFDDDEARRVLNGIVHPLVRAETERQVSALPDEHVVVHDVPLIVENDMGAQYHLVVVVGASEPLRLERAVARGLTPEAATARMAAQADDAARRRAADVWVDNEGTEEQLRAVVELLWRARIVPFATNLASGRWAEAGERSGAPEDGRTEAADRLLARLARIAGPHGPILTGLRYREAGPDAQLDVVEIEATATRDEIGDKDLLSAGFVGVRPGVFASADPGRPAVLELTHERTEPGR